jgi:hypothetical protein
MGRRVCLIESPQCSGDENYANQAGVMQLHVRSFRSVLLAMWHYRLGLFDQEQVFGIGLIGRLDLLAQPFIRGKSEARQTYASGRFLVDCPLSLDL